MAQKVTKITRVPTHNGDTGLVLDFPEKASATFAEGDLVVTTAGQIDECGADPAKVLGIALKAKTGTTNSMIPVLVIRPGDVFLMPFLAADTFAVADHGVSYGVTTPSAGRWEVDTAETTADVVVVLGSPERNAETGALAATAGGPVFVSFISTVLEFGTAD